MQTLLMPEPGYYLTSYRAIRLGEWIRLSGILRLPFALMLRRQPPTDPVWMPALRSDMACEKSDLSEQFSKVLNTYGPQFEQLGFTPCGFNSLKRHLHSKLRDSSSVVYIDRSRTQIGQLLYVRIYQPPPINADLEQVTLAFMMSFQRGLVSYSNFKGGFDPPPGQMVVRMPRALPAKLHARMLHDLRDEIESPRQFPDHASVSRFLDEMAIETFRAGVQRGLYLRMNDAQVEQARRKLLASSE